jgi:hypothetical protein
VLVALGTGQCAMKPPFVKVVPDEVERFGAPAAIVLAHIRYRCESDGPDRFEIDGVRWWRVSTVDLGSEVGLSRQTVRTALLALSQVVSANAFTRWDADARTIDQTRAYRVLTCERLESTEPDVRMVASNQDVVGINHDPGWNQPGAWLESTNVPSIETLETKDREEGEAPARQHEPPSAELVPDRLNDRPPQTNPRGTRGTRLSPDWMPSQDVIDAMTSECPNVDLEAEHRKFIDHWTDKTGKDATKVTWDGTWRNWIRREAKFQQRSGPTRNGRSTADLRVEQTQALKDQPSRLELG